MSVHRFSTCNNTSHLFNIKSLAPAPCCWIVCFPIISEHPESMLVDGECRGVEDPCWMWLGKPLAPGSSTAVSPPQLTCTEEEAQ